MIRNFFLISIRNIFRNKSFSLINIFGLAIGLVCSILIALFVFNELSYDRYHKNAKNIYRVGIDASLNGSIFKAYVTGAPVGNTFREEIPEVLSSTRVIKWSFDEDKTIIKVDSNIFVEENLFYVDSTFTAIFDVDFIAGNPKEALNKPGQIIITETSSNIYFGDENPIGKSLKISGNDFTISGVVKDCPGNSHFHYNMLASLVGTWVTDLTTWMSNDFSYTYLLLEEGADLEKVSGLISQIGREHTESEFLSMFGEDIESLNNPENHFSYIIQPIVDIHLHSHTDFEMEPNSSMSQVYIFIITALIILIVACINFMNLSTARSAKRAKEVAIRKIIGAKRRNLFLQFLFESVILSTIALFIALIIIESILPLFNTFIGKHLSLGYSEHPVIIAYLFLLAISVGIFSGLYSAGFMSGIKIMNVIKTNLFSGKNHSWFRNILVIFQFSISIILICSTIIIYKQLQLIKEKDIGFNKKNILVINKGNHIEDSYEAFKQELLKNPIIQDVSFSNSLPGKLFSGFPVNVEGINSNKSYVPRMITVDYDFARTYNLSMAEGRFFSEDYPSDSFAIVINEAARKEMEIESPATSKKLITNFNNIRTEWPIVGVVKDFNFRSLHQKVGALVIIANQTNPELISVRFRSNINEKGILYVQEKWNEFTTDSPFDYSILEDDFNNLHKEEFKTGELFVIFSILAILIACLGLLGLVLFIVEQKTKEIGIRKAMGSTVLNIVFLLLKQFSSWVLAANIIAWPLAYYFISRWLQNFAYQVKIDWWVFPVAGILALFIAIFTVSFQSIYAANQNPVDSLRYE